MDMMKQMVLSILPPDLKAEIERAMQELQARGRTESVTEVPGVGNSRITIVKLEE